MRLIKMSKELTPTREELAFYFENPTSEFRTKHDTFGIFMFTKGRISEGRISPGERILFSYDGVVVYTAKAVSAPLPTTGPESEDYPYYLQIDLASLHKASIPLAELQQAIAACTGENQNLMGQGWTRLPDSPDIEMVVMDLVTSSTDMTKRYKQLESRVNEIVAKHCLPQRISLRTSAEKEAASIVASHLGTLTSEELAQVLTLVDKDFHNEKEKLGRFGLTFLGANSAKICSNIEAANAVIKKLWESPEADMYLLIDQYMKEKPVSGAGIGFYSLIPYLRDPQKFSIWIDAMIVAIGAIENRRLTKKSGDDYRQYNIAVNAFKNWFQLEPQALDIVLTELNKQDIGNGGRSKAFEALKKRFLASTPGFVSFQEPGEFLQKAELDYKRQAAVKARELLKPYVDGVNRVDDIEGKELAQKLFKLTNFLNWRDLQYVDELLASQGRWSKYWRLVLPLLAKSEAIWEGPLSELLGWLAEIGCKANISKLITTYPLFLWNPIDHFFIKPSLTDAFLKALMLPPLGDGKPLTLEGYKRVLDTCSEIGNVDLADWLPQDNIDIHTFVWMSCSGDPVAEESGLWWVNQGASYVAESRDGYIFAPMQDQRGASLGHWNNLSKAKKGDLVFHYVDQAIRAVSTVTAEAIELNRPSGSIDDEKGRLVRCSYIPLSRPVYLDSIPLEQRVAEGGPFNKNGGVKQAYLLPLSQCFVDLITPLVGLEAIEKAKRGTSEINEVRGECMEKTAIGENIIYYGPPGTGKTHKLRELFEEYTSPPGQVPKEAHLTQLVIDKPWWQIVAAAVLSSGPIKVPDLLGHALIKAKLTQNRIQDPNARLWSTLQTHTVADCPHVNHQRRNEPLIFSKDSEATWSVSPELVLELAPEVAELKTALDEICGGPEKPLQRYTFVTFHQSYGYEEFVEGIRPLLNKAGEGHIGYRLEPGVFKNICDEAKQNPDRKYAIFIDEINRGNISKIFGELITLIELDKRVTGNGEGMKVTLPYSKEEFGVPTNLSIIGTMNTADRSIAFIDIALRRRFRFREMMPDPEVIRTKVGQGGVVDGVDIGKMLETINRRIEFLYDRDHMIGHSFFLKCSNIEDIRHTLLLDIIPLLQEYFYGDWEKISLVLGCGTNGNGGETKNKYPIIKAEKLLEIDILGLDHADFDDCYRYEVNLEFKKATVDPKNYLTGIYLKPEAPEA